MLHMWYGFRRMAERARRHARRVIGKPDNTPWLVEPRRRSHTTYVDLMFGLDYLNPTGGMVQLMHKAMAPYGLRFLPVNRHSVESTLERIKGGRLRPLVYLDLCSEPGDPFRDLLRTAEAAGVHTISKAADQQWVLKAPAQEPLERAGLPLPPTVIFKKGEPDRDLTSDERAKVGDRVVVKPSNGFAGLGVVVGVEPTKENIAAARDFNRDDDFLVQKMIAWKRFPDRPAYFRGYNLFGARALVWWAKDNGKDTYRLMSWEDARKYDLLPAVGLVDRLAETTGMEYFSTEIAVVADSGPPERRFCVIDYVNDQCDIDPFAHAEFSPPEPLCAFAYERLAEFVWRKKHGLPTDRAGGGYRPLFLHA